MPATLTDMKEAVVSSDAKDKQESQSYFAQACNAVGSALTSTKHVAEDTATMGMDGVKYAGGVGGKLYHDRKEDAELAYGIGGNFLQGCKTMGGNAIHKTGELFGDGVQKVHEVTDNPNRRNSEVAEKKEEEDVKTEQ